VISIDLMWIKECPYNLCRIGSSQREPAMESHDFYFLVMVCAVFGIFTVVMAASSFRYRSWLKHQPHQAADD
jgi:hypothetical protein